jgi:hypothetical protein
VFISWKFVRELLYLSIGGFRGFVKWIQDQTGTFCPLLGAIRQYSGVARQPSSQPSSCFWLSVTFLTKLEFVRKRDLYARFGIPEYWYVDLEAERVAVYALEEDRYPTPLLSDQGCKDTGRYPYQGTRPRRTPDMRRRHHTQARLKSCTEIYCRMRCLPPSQMPEERRSRSGRCDR